MLESLGCFFDKGLTMDERSKVVFVNSVAQAGFLNGIYNVAFSTAEFVPGEKGPEAREFISANLRMDLLCAQQLYESLGKVIADQTKPAPMKHDVN
jgi:hypothetical protein